MSATVATPPTKFTQDVVWVTASLAAFAIGGAVWAVMTAHGLGTAGRGNLNLVGVTIVLAGLGCAAGSNYWLPSVIREDAVHTREIIGAMLVVGGIVNAVALVVVVVVGAALTIAAIYGILIAATLTLLPASWLKTLASSVLSAGRDFKGLFVAGLLGQLVQLGGGTFLLVTDRMTVGTAIAATTAGAVVNLAALVPLAHRTVPFHGIGPSRASIRRVLKAGVATMPGVLGQSLNYRVDLLVVAAVSGAEAVGIYGIAVLVAEILFYPALIVSQVLLPRSAQLGSGGAEPAYRIVLAATLAVSTLLFVTAPMLIEHVFGPGFLEASPALRALLPGLMAMALWQLTTFELVGRGKLFLLSASALTGVTVTLIADLLLVPRYNVRGAAISATLGYLATTTVVLPALRSELGYRIRDLILLRPSDVALVRAELAAVVRALRPDRARGGADLG